MWDLQLRQLLLPKLDHDASECEDAIAFDIQTGRFAVTDGATEAFHAQQWAKNLAEHWVRNEATLTLDEFRNWVATEGRELHDSWKGLNLSWYSEEKARTGSFAAFVGVEIDLKTPSWKAIALGDTCLLHCRGGALLKSLPLSRSENFNSTPILVASNAALHESTMSSAMVESGVCENGDVLFLMSDAAASWCLQCFENGDFDADFLTGDDEELRRFFDGERQAGRIRNDDIAIVRIEIKRRIN